LEFVDGSLVCIAPIGHKHVYMVDLRTELLAAEVRGRGIPRDQSTLRFNSGEAPEPALVLLRQHPDRRRSREAGPGDTMLVVEVVDSSLKRDLEKAELYARAAIPEYWIVDVNAPAVRVHLARAGGEYTDVRQYGRGEAFSSAALNRDVRVGEE
jgi:Uma2 family endonuclease